MKQPQQQQAPGRVELKRPPTRLRNLLIVFCILVIFYIGIAIYLLLWQKWPLVSVEILALVYFIFTLPLVGPGFIRALNDAINDPDRRHYREEKIKTSAEQRREQQATSAAGSAPESVNGPGPDALAILGGANVGTLPWSIGPYLVLPRQELTKHGVVIGASGTGKTVSLFRLAYVAATVYGYRVFFIDGKGDHDTAAQFLATMHQAGRASAMFPRQAFNGFHGDGPAILNRLMAVLDFSEPYYEDVARDVLTAVCINHPAARPPRDSIELLHRLDALPVSSNKRDIKCVILRYRSFFGVLAGSLDNGWSWEDTQTGYVLLDGLSLKKQAASLGRYLLEDFAHYAAQRKRPSQRDLLIVDEYSAISTGSDAANLIERLRSYGCAVVLSSQSYAGLGEERDAERILDAANWLLLHRTAAPERLTSRAGTILVEKEAYQLGGFTHGAARASMEEEDQVHPDQARRLAVGEAIMIAHGHYIRARISPPPEPDPAMVSKARAWIDQPIGQLQPSARYSQANQPQQSTGPHLPPPVSL